MIGYLKLNPSYSHLYNFLRGFKQINTLLDAFLIYRSIKSGLQNHMHEIYNGKRFLFLAALKSFTIQTWHLSSMSTVKLPFLKKISRTCVSCIFCIYEVWLFEVLLLFTISYYYWGSKFVLTLIRISSIFSVKRQSINRLFKNL